MQHLEEIPSMTRAEVNNLSAYVKQETKHIEKNMKFFLKKKDIRKFSNFIYTNFLSDSNYSLPMSKNLFDVFHSYYEKVYPNFAQLPPHTMIFLEPTDCANEKLKFILLEASIFEDLAIMWNECIDLKNSMPVQREIDFYLSKKLAAMLRSVVKTSFNLLEGYLNGIAQDILLTQTKLSKYDEGLLKEWNFDQKRSNFLSPKMKLHEYLRIAGANGNAKKDNSHKSLVCKTLNFSKLYRQSLIHPSPVPERSGKLSRDYVHFDIDIEQTSRVCDTVLQLLKSINKTIEYKFGDISKVWLVPKDNNNKFELEFPA